MKRSASAVWRGDLKTGKGAISTQSGVLKDSAYGFNTRFENGPGTNPEELIGAAHAGCFSMALANELSQAGIQVEELRTQATVTLEQQGQGFTITAVHLQLHATLPGADAATFEELANKAKANCPVSKLLNAAITLDATLV